MTVELNDRDVRDTDLLDAVRSHLHPDRAAAVLVRTPADPASPELLAVLAGDAAARSEHVSLPLPAGGAARVELLPMASLDALAAKVGRNLRSVPGSSLIRFGRLPAAGDGGRPSLPAVRPSSPPLLPLADAIARTVPLLERFRPRWRGSVKLSYITVSEHVLIEKLQTWRSLDGAARLDPFWERLHASGLPLQLALLYVATFYRSLEDVEGMTGVHMSTAVALAARIAFAQLGRALAGAEGALRNSEQAMLEWARTRGPEVEAEFARGLFPDVAAVDAHVQWLRDTQASHIRGLRRNWLFRLLLREADRWVDTNAAPALKRNLRDDEYVAPPVPRDTAALDATLDQYRTSAADLAAMTPCADDAAIRITGSIAEGWGHARSDLDLIVLTSDVPALPSISASIVEGHYECKLGSTPAGNGVWVEYLTDEVLDRLADWTAGTRADLTGEPEGAVERLRAVRSSPMARLVHRSMLSLPLRDGACARGWEERLSVETYAAAMVTSNLLEYWVLRRRAEAYAARDSLSALALGRRAWSYALLALLASRGTFVWGGERWIPSGLARLGDPDLAARARRGLLPAPDESGAAYLAWLDEQVRGILGAIRLPDSEGWAARAGALE
jgi:hypothetical protein